MNVSLSTNPSSLPPSSPDARDILDSDAFTEPPANPLRPIAPTIEPKIVFATEPIPPISFDPRPTIALPTIGNFPKEPVSPFAITPPSFPKPRLKPFPRAGINFVNIPFVSIGKRTGPKSLTDAIKVPPNANAFIRPPKKLPPPPSCPNSPGCPFDPLLPLSPFKPCKPRALSVISCFCFASCSSKSLSSL